MREKNMIAIVLAAFISGRLYGCISAGRNKLRQIDVDWGG